jgi:hypothetical protein
LERVQYFLSRWVQYYRLLNGDSEGESGVSRIVPDLSLEELESKNHLVCRVLTAMGFDGRHFKVELPRKPAPKRKDAPTSAAYDRKFYVELSEASTAGKTFALTGGST